MKKYYDIKKFIKYINEKGNYNFKIVDIKKKDKGNQFYGISAKEIYFEEPIFSKEVKDE